MHRTLGTFIAMLGLSLGGCAGSHEAELRDPLPPPAPVEGWDPGQEFIRRISPLLLARQISISVTIPAEAPDAVRDRPALYLPAETDRFLFGELRVLHVPSRMLKAGGLQSFDVQGEATVVDAFGHVVFTEALVGSRTLALTPEGAFEVVPPGKHRGPSARECLDRLADAIRDAVAEDI